MSSVYQTRTAFVHATAAYRFPVCHARPFLIGFRRSFSLLLRACAMTTPAIPEFRVPAHRHSLGLHIFTLSSYLHNQYHILHHPLSERRQLV